MYMCSDCISFVYGIKNLALNKASFCKRFLNEFFLLVKKKFRFIGFLPTLLDNNILGSRSLFDRLLLIYYASVIDWLLNLL